MRVGTHHQRAAPLHVRCGSVVEHEGAAFVCWGFGSTTQRCLWNTTKAQHTPMTAGTCTARTVLHGEMLVLVGSSREVALNVWKEGGP